MADSERKVFPVEAVLALAAGKEDVDLKEIAGYILGQSIACNRLARATAPFAAAWVARLYPKFAEIVWDEEKEGWSNFVSRAAAVLGEKVSLPPMSGSMMTACQSMLKAWQEKEDEVAALRREVASLSGQVETLKPLEGKLATALKKADGLEEQLKEQKKEVGNLRRQTLEFQGKMAINHEELLDAIKDAIKENLKHVAIQAPATVAGAAPVAGMPQAAAPAAGAAGGADDFGFGGSGDEFGFGGGSGDEFGFGGGSSSGDDFGFGGGASAPATAAAPAPEPEPADEFGFASTKDDEFGF